MVVRGPWDRRRRHQRSAEWPPLSPALQARIRSLIDRYQVLCLQHPAVAAWLIEWVDRFLRTHLD